MFHDLPVVLGSIVTFLGGFFLQFWNSANQTIHGLRFAESPTVLATQHRS